jgi:selenocysteine lyase/cysteine desulfurase
MNVLGVSGLYAGQKWLESQGISNIHKREMELWKTLKQGLQSIDGVTTYCADGSGERNAVLSFNVKGWEASDVGTILDVDHHIACRTGLQCAPMVHQQIGTDKIHGTVRFSLGPFNTEDHVQKAIDAVTEIASMKRA